MLIVLRKIIISVFGVLKWVGVGNKVILFFLGLMDVYIRWKNVGWIVFFFGVGGGFKGIGWYGWNGVFIFEEDGVIVGDLLKVLLVLCFLGCER